MARINGVDLPNEKRAEIGLTYIYGIGRTTAAKMCADLNIVDGTRIKDLTEEQIRTAGFDTYFVDRTAGVYPTAASGFPYSAASMAVKGDRIADLTEDLAAEQKARVTYDNILRLSDDPDVNDVIKFLRAREIVHFQRFGEGLRLAKDKMNEKNLYFVNPSFDK